MRLKRALRILVTFISGVWSGLFVAQGFYVLALRNGGWPGGEAMTLFVIPMLAYFGFMVGEDFGREKWFGRGYEQGVRFCNDNQAVRGPYYMRKGQDGKAQ